MLRYVKFDLLQRSIIEFCCSRVIFSNVNIHIPDDSLLFDNDFIERELKRYKRNGEEYADIIHGICGKCDGFGFFDWVTHIRTEEGVDEETIFRSDLSKPVKVKNENPIETVFAYVDGSDRLYVYYISHIEDDPLIYRCDQCNGTGLDHDFSRYGLKKCKPSDLIDIKPSPIKEPPSDASWFRKIIRTLRVIYLIGRIYARNYKNRKLYANK
jgi:hypothetical protein